MTHPGNPTLPRPLDAAAVAAGYVGGAGCGGGPDEFALDPGREHELRVLLDAEGALAAGLRALRVTRASYADFLAVAGGR